MVEYNSYNKEKIIQKAETFSKKIRKRILEMAYNAGANSSHFGGALSTVEVISSLFSYQMNLKNGNPNHQNNDKFILSKGHGCLSYYAALCEVGYLNSEELITFEKDGSNLLGHPIMNKKIGIEFSNGSLGMGLSLGIGQSIAMKKKKKNNNIYVILGDGECNEGSVWEAVMAASNYKLDNLIAIIDNNKFQQTGSNQEIMDMMNITEKWKSFGWDVNEVDGHNLNEIFSVLKKDKIKNKPKAIVAKTIKGKGFTFSENNNDWHHKVLTKAMYEKGLSELGVKNEN